MSDNPYAAPRADLQTAATGTTAASGSLDAGIAGRYELGIGSVMSEAWQLAKGAKLPILVATIVMMAISWLVSAGLAVIGIGADAASQDGNAGAGIMMGFLSSVIAWPITLPLTAGLTMMGVRRATGAKVGVGELFRYYNRIPGLIGISLLSTIFIMIGFALLILPGIYLSLAYLLAMQVMLDKNIGPWQALEASRKAITHHWFAVFGLMLVVTILTVLSALPLFLGLIWTVPWLLLCLGVVYRRVFGVEPATVAASQPQAHTAPAL